jgi:hypothetical protein
MEDVRTARPRAIWKWSLAILEERNSSAINAIISLGWTNFRFYYLFSALLSYSTGRSYLRVQQLLRYIQSKKINQGRTPIKLMIIIMNKMNDR